MTDRYLRSTTGANGNSGLTWALARANLASALSGSAANDNIWVSKSHNETVSGVCTAAWGGSVTTGTVKLVSVDDTNNPQPPTSPAAGATITAAGFNLTGTAVYVEGVKFAISAADTNAQMLLAATNQRYKSCTFDIGNSQNSDPLIIGPTSYTVGGSSEFVDCSFLFSQQSNGLEFRAGTHLIRGGSVSVVGNVYAVVAGSYAGAMVTFEGVDMSSCSATSLVTYMTGQSRVIFRNCKTKDGAVVGVSGSVTVPGAEAFLINCDVSTVASTYRYEYVSYWGLLLSTTSVYCNGGAQVNNFNVAWMVNSYRAVWPMGFASPEIFSYLATFNASMVASVEILAPAGMTNKDIWLEVEFQGDAATVGSSIASSQMTSWLSATSALTASGKTWTGLPANTVAYTLSVPISPRQAGVLSAKVRLGTKQNIYIDPTVTVV